MTSDWQADAEARRDREDEELDRYNGAYRAWDEGGRVGPGPCRPGDEESALYAQLHEDAVRDGTVPRTPGYQGRHRHG